MSIEVIYGVLNYCHYVFVKGEEIFVFVVISHSIASIKPEETED